MNHTPPRTHIHMYACVCACVTTSVSLHVCVCAVSGRNHDVDQLLHTSTHTPSRPDTAHLCRRESCMTVMRRRQVGHLVTGSCTLVHRYMHAQRQDERLTLTHSISDSDSHVLSITRVICVLILHLIL